MDIELRPYQQQALDTIMSAIPSQEAILTMAATGAGKTIIFLIAAGVFLLFLIYLGIAIL